MKLIEIKLILDQDQVQYESTYRSDSPWFPRFFLCRHGLEENFHLPLVREIWVSLHNRPSKDRIKVTLLHYHKGYFHLCTPSGEWITATLPIKEKEDANMNRFLDRKKTPKPIYVQTQYLTDGRGRPLHPM